MDRKYPGLVYMDHLFFLCTSICEYNRLYLNFLDTLKFVVLNLYKIFSHSF